MPSGALVRPALQAAAGSHAGLQRDNNEDRFHCDPQRGVFMVIDGVGGHAAGEKAAATALAMIRARLERETGSPAERVREAITLANNEIFRLAASEPAWAGMACVLTVALVRDGRLTIGHVGDTRLYALSRGRVSKVTHDHSPVGEREDRGDLNEAEAMRHPRRNEIYRDVGSQHHDPGDEEFIETIDAAFEPDTALVLCTDGLSDMVPSTRLAQIVAQHAAEPALVVERLIEAANAAGGKDNVTAVFVAGPRFAESASRFLSNGPASPQRTATAAAGWGARVRGAIASRPAMLAYGIAAGLVLAAGLMVATDALPDRLLELSRPAGWARTWRVGQQDAEFPTIQAALARAAAGDIVEVDAGTYDLPLAVPPGVHLVSRKPREAVLRAPAAAAGAPDPAVTVAGGSRLAGFKIDAAGLAAGVALADSAQIENVEISGAREAAVVFGTKSRGVLSSSYIHDNLASGVVVEDQAMPRLLHNVVTKNGLPGAAEAAHAAAPAASGARRAAVPAPRSPAIVLRPGASAVFFGNIVAGNADDQIAGLVPEQRPDVVRDNVIGLQASPARPAGSGRRAPVQAPPAAAPRQRDTGGR
jgi:serine/threonine protein phosphatase PrpC